VAPTYANSISYRYPCYILNIISFYLAEFSHAANGLKVGFTVTERRMTEGRMTEGRK
jgi:hypothetical protein